MAADTPGKARSRLGSLLRRYFLTGILVVTPAAVAAWVLYKLLSFVDTMLWDEVRLGWVRPGGIPGVGLIIVLGLVLLVGFLVNNFLGRRFYQMVDAFLGRIPLFNKIYVALQQIGEALLSGDKSVFRSVAIVEFPRPGVWCLVFLTETPNQAIQTAAGETLRSVFLPTTPNPTTGFLLMLPERDIHPVAMSVEEGLKMVISGGAYMPGRGPGGEPVSPRTRP